MTKILVIEDEEPVRENLVELLQAEGYACLDAPNGEAGIRKAWESQPDLILCDILMPGLDGFGVWATLSKDPATAGIPFIYLTAKIERADQRRGMDLGADDYITKPFTRRELLRAIRTRLEKHRSLTLQAQARLKSLTSSINQALPHELLTPLSVILSYSEMILEDPRPADWSQAVAMVRGIHGSALALLRSIQNFLLITELEHARSDPARMTDTRSGSQADSEIAISEIARIQADQAGRLTDLRLDVQPVALRISEIHLEKIVEELLDNAFKYSPVGSVVELTARLSPPGGLYELRVADGGRGIEADRLVEITTFRGLEGNPYEASGIPVGMGLILVRRLVDLYDGSFQIESRPGAGTTVTIRLPILDSPV